MPIFSQKKLKWTLTFKFSTCWRQPTIFVPLAKKLPRSLQFSLDEGKRHFAISKIVRDCSMNSHQKLIGWLRRGINDGRNYTMICWQISWTAILQLLRVYNVMFMPQGEPSEYFLLWIIILLQITTAKLCSIPWIRNVFCFRCQGDESVSSHGCNSVVSQK